MDIGTEQVFLVNSSELDEHTTTPLQRAFAMPVAAMEPEDIQQTTVLSQLPQSDMDPPSRTNMCRLCATVTELVVPIFEAEGLQNSLADKIHQHLPIQVSPNDTLPIVMCFQCTSTLLAWHELVVCSVQADSVMRERFNQHISSTQQQQEQSKAEVNETQNEDDKCRPTSTRGRPGPARSPARPKPAGVNLEDASGPRRGTDEVSRGSARGGGPARGGGSACARCGRAFPGRAQLARHEARHARRGEHACPQCGRAFSVASDLRRHAAAHRPGRHRCPRCAAVFKQPRYLRVHLRNVHLESPPRAAPRPAPAARSPGSSPNARDGS